MLKFIAEEITLRLISNKIIKIENRNYYIYGIELLLSNIIISASILIISIITNNIIISIVFAIIFQSLRAYSGGYHCKKFIHCYFFSTAIYISMLVANELIVKFQELICISLLCASFPIIFIFSPKEHKNNPLQINEKKKYKKICVIMLCLYTFLSLLCLFFNKYSYSISITWAISASAVLILLSRKGD